MDFLRKKSVAARPVCILAVVVLTTATLPAPVGAQSTGNGTLLVLRSGKVVDGRISQNAGGYMVEYKNGSMLVPRSQVLLLAESRRDAYAKLKDALPRKSVQKTCTPC